MSEIPPPPYRTKRKQRSSKRKKRVEPYKCKRFLLLLLLIMMNLLLLLTYTATVSDSKIINVTAQDGENDEPTGNRIIDLGIPSSVFSIVSWPECSCIGLKLISNLTFKNVVNTFCNTLIH